MDEELLKRLAPLRARIDEIDQQVLALLSERARVATEVGEVKKHVDGPIWRPEREAQVIRSLQEASQGPLPAASIAAIWVEIMSACRALERRFVVAYLGPEGTFSEQAALAHFGQAIETQPCRTIDDVFRAVETQRADFGVVPVENSTEGSVTRTADLLLSTNARVSGERSLPIRHMLLNASGERGAIRKVCGHPQSLAQCQQWLAQNLPGVELESVNSNAEAARLASTDTALAAIASERAAQVWGLQIAQANIQDDPQNRTRFLVIGHLETWPSGRDKTSVVLAVPNRPGAVYRMLAPLAEHGVSMSRFESRPARTGQWEYYFYVDMEGHAGEAHVARALDALREYCAYYKLLGSYPVA